MKSSNTDVFFKKYIKSYKQGPDGHKGWAKRAAGKMRRNNGKVAILRYLKGYDNG